MAPKHKQKRQWLCSVNVCKANSSNANDEPGMTFTPKLHKNLMKVKVGNQAADCLLDTGAAICAISQHLLKQVAPSAQIKPSHLTAIVGVCGERHSVLGMVELNFSCEGPSFTHSFHVFEHLHVKMLVGIDFGSRALLGTIR